VSSAAVAGSVSHSADLLISLENALSSGRDRFAFGSSFSLPFFSWLFLLFLEVQSRIYFVNKDSFVSFPRDLFALGGFWSVND